MFFRRKPQGFTLAELIIATFIFATSMVIIGTSSVNFYRGYKRQLARDALYEETRILIDRIANEVRQNTVDFDEYFNRLPESAGGKGSNGPLAYGEHYREYRHYFYTFQPSINSFHPNDPNRELYYDSSEPQYPADLDEGFFSTDGFENQAADDATLSALGDNNQQEELYLISADGRQKTILKRVENGLDDDFDGTPDNNYLNDTGEEQIGILRLDIADRYDNEGFTSSTLTPVDTGDGYYDCWVGSPDFPDRNFIPISPPSIEVKDLQFFISPIEDPFKAYTESDVRVQAHPNVTIVLKTQVSAETLRRFYSETPPNLTLSTTVSSRVYNNVEIPFESNGDGIGDDESQCQPSGGWGNSVCGDGVVTGIEECDGADLNGNTCLTVPGRFVAGTLGCTSSCTFDTSGCNTTGGSCSDPSIPACNSKTATICVINGTIVGGGENGNAYAGVLTSSSGDDDVMVGTEGNDQIIGGNKSDTICALGGDDYIEGGVNDGSESEYINGGAGNDEIHGDTGSDELYGGTGDDIIYGGNHPDLIYGEEGNDTLYGDSNEDSLFGGDGDDKLDGGSHTDEIHGDSGTDLCKNGEAPIAAENCEGTW